MAIAWKVLASIKTAEGALELRQRGEREFLITIAGRVLMTSVARRSEEALSTLACAKLSAHSRAPRVVIGGLGMGFTLRAALDVAGESAGIAVAELVPAVVAWNRTMLAALSGDALADPRVTVHEADVAGLIGAAPAAWDAILLDVDNGPVAMARAANDRLYDLAGLRAAHAALRPGGVLAVWSAIPDAGFTRRLRAVGFAADAVTVRARGARGGPRHTIWVAVRPAAAGPAGAA